jgi:hypothetical protein
MFNGTIKFRSDCLAIATVGQLSTIRLTDMRLVVAKPVPRLPGFLGNVSAVVLQATGPGTSLILENCTFEVAFDSPALDRLVGCVARQGAHVCLKGQPIWVVV